MVLVSLAPQVRINYRDVLSDSKNFLLKEKLKIKAYCIDEITNSSRAYIDKGKVDNAMNKIKEAIDIAQKNKTGQTIRVKVLKNRNGQNNGLFKLRGYLDRYFIDDVPKEEQECPITKARKELNNQRT